MNELQTATMEELIKEIKSRCDAAEGSCVLAVELDHKGAYDGFLAMGKPEFLSLVGAYAQRVAMDNLFESLEESDGASDVV